MLSLELEIIILLSSPIGFFDLVYSNQVFTWLKEPIDSLKEQKRVTRSGGWVVILVTSHEFWLLYPDCPEVRKVVKAIRALKNAPEEVGFVNICAPQEVVSFMVEAGFRNYKIISQTPNTEIAYPFHNTA